VLAVADAHRLLELPRTAELRDPDRDADQPEASGANAIHQVARRFSNLVNV
jgi:hypothetical protein